MAVLCGFVRFCKPLLASCLRLLIWPWYRAKPQKVYHPQNLGFHIYAGPWSCFVAIADFWWTYRNLPLSIRDIQPDVVSQDGLEIKICVRTYRLFFVSKSEDFLWKIPTKEETLKASECLKAREVLRQKWLDNARKELWCCVSFIICFKCFYLCISRDFCCYYLAV